MSCSLRATVGALSAFLLAAPGAAQQSQPPLATIVEGLTLDAQTGLPFPNVQLRFDTGERITSDEAGRYAIEGIEPGYHRIALVTGRCQVSFADLALDPEEIKRIAFEVPSEMVGVRPGHDELRKRSEGSYYSSEDLQELRARNLLESLRRIAPDMVGPLGGQPGAGATLMGRTRTAQGVVPPLVVVDGIQVYDGVRTLQEFRPQEIYSLEVLKGASRGWAYGTGASGGVIRVVTRQGDTGHGVLHPDRCEIGDWQNGP